MAIPKMVLCIGHRVLRLIPPPPTPGVALTGCNKIVINGKFVCQLGSKTYAGSVLSVNNKVWANNKPMATAPGKCSEGISLFGDPKVILG